MIQIYDAVERQLVATGAAIIALQGAGNCGVTHCVLQWAGGFRSVIRTI